jgi:pilus assembly protein Flp/PilA
MGEAEQNGRLSDAAGGRAAGRLAARSALRAFLRDTAGATAVEYGLIVTLIFLTIIGALTSFGHNATNVINTASNAIGGAM